MNLNTFIKRAAKAAAVVMLTLCILTGIGIAIAVASIPLLLVQTAML